MNRFFLILLGIQFSIPKILLAQKTDDHPIILPTFHSEIAYEFSSGMDSSLSKERIYRACLNWYYKTFPYGHSNLLDYDLKKGNILARGEYKFPYFLGFDELSMKIHFLLEIHLRYGKYQILIHQIEPEDQMEDEDYSSKKYPHYEPRSLKIMYSQYLESNDPPEFMVEKLQKIHSYFMGLIQSFKSNLKIWTRPNNSWGF